MTGRELRDILDDLDEHEIEQPIFDRISLSDQENLIEVLGIERDSGEDDFGNTELWLVIDTP
jgi:hypothetical protein